MENILQWKMTSLGRQPPMEKDLKTNYEKAYMKKTLNIPQNQDSCSIGEIQRKY
jgi:hypothetical protein